jgi:ubiquinone/menaquinone biosynthesis C-methylase UbiE
MANADAIFSSAIARFYERHFGPALFGPYAADIAGRLRDVPAGALLEVAAGTGIVTATLARDLLPTVAITATDLNQPMLDFAMTKPGLDRVTWQQADAQSLPFPDARFDIVVCQFGVMFFPDRPRAHAEARRVLKPGGRYIFNVWDSLAHNPASDVVQRAVAGLYPAQPPRFIRRTPFGYHDPAVIRRDLQAAGFEDCTVETVAATWAAASARDPAIAFCQGSPMRAEIEAVDPDGPGRATDAAEAAILAHFGSGAPAFPTQAMVIEARR